MKKSRYKEEQIIAVLKEVDAGAKLQDVVRRLGVSEQTYYRWKAKYSGMEVMRRQEAQGARVRESPTEADGRRPGARPPGAEGGGRKKMVKPAAYRQAVGFLRGEFEFSERRACTVLPAIELSLHREADVGAGPARRHPSSRRSSAAVRLSAHPRAAPAWRLAREPQARLSHLPSRGSRCPTEKAQEDGHRSAHRAATAESSE
jgi:Transposase